MTSEKEEVQLLLFEWLKQQQKYPAVHVYRVVNMHNPFLDHVQHMTEGPVFG